MKKVRSERKARRRSLKLWIAAVAGAITAIALFLSNLNTIMTIALDLVNRIGITQGDTKPHLEIVELAMSDQLREWKDFSDQVPSILDDIKRLEEVSGTNGLDSFSFKSRRYKNTVPHSVTVWYPSPEYMEQSKRLFDWDFDSDRRLFESSSLSRESLLINISFQNNTSHQIEIIQALLRINKVSMDWTSAGDVIELQPEKHLPIASKIYFRWPISPEEPYEQLLDHINTPREDLATFKNPLLIASNKIERVLIQIDIPKFDFFGRQNTLVQLIFHTSEGELASEQIYITTTERAYKN